MMKTWKQGWDEGILLMRMAFETLKNLSLKALLALFSYASLSLLLSFKMLYHFIETPFIQDMVLTSDRDVVWAVAMVLLFFVVVFWNQVYFSFALWAGMFAQKLITDKKEGGNAELPDPDDTLSPQKKDSKPSYGPIFKAYALSGAYLFAISVLSFMVFSTLFFIPVLNLLAPLAAVALFAINSLFLMLLMHSSVSPALLMPRLVGSRWFVLGAGAPWALLALIPGMHLFALILPLCVRQEAMQACEGIMSLVEPQAEEVTS